MNAHTSGFYIMRAGTGGVSLCDRFAEALSESGSIVEAAAAAGVPPEIGEALFKSICRKLGGQAR
jgi:hypothetical protein